MPVFFIVYCCGRLFPVINRAEAGSRRAPSYRRPLTRVFSKGLVKKEGDGMRCGCVRDAKRHETRSSLGRVEGTILLLNCKSTVCHTTYLVPWYLYEYSYEYSVQVKCIVRKIFFLEKKQKTNKRKVARERWQKGHKIKGSRGGYLINGFMGSYGLSWPHGCRCTIERLRAKPPAQK